LAVLVNVAGARRDFPQLLQLRTHFLDGAAHFLRVVVHPQAQGFADAAQFGAGGEHHPRIAGAFVDQRQHGQRACRRVVAGHQLGVLGPLIVGRVDGHHREAVAFFVQPANLPI